MRKMALGLGVALVAVVVAAQVRPTFTARTEDMTATEPVERVQKVEVVNFPHPQDVAGTVSVGNFPAVQQVTGEVAVSNLPLDSNGNLRVADHGGQQRFGFVGVTSQQFDGAAGFATMTRACYQQYPGSRVAFTDEYLTTVNPPDVTETAWIQSRPIAVARDYYVTVLDASGVVDDPYNFNCNSWNGGPRGLCVTPTGAFIGSPCSQMHPVACAAPQ